MEKTTLTLQSTFNSKWVLWYHHIKNNWTIDGYRQIYTISTIEDFWILYNNWDKIGGINNKHFFLMREGILPLWESEHNSSGGCWSYKKNEKEANNLWTDLSLHLVGETLSNESELLNGISICLKTRQNSVIKIWNKNKNKNNINLINQDILKKWGVNLIFINNKKE